MRVKNRSLIKISSCYSMVFGEIVDGKNLFFVTFVMSNSWKVMLQLSVMYQDLLIIVDRYSVWCYIQLSYVDILNLQENTNYIEYPYLKNTRAYKAHFWKFVQNSKLILREYNIFINSYIWIRNWITMLWYIHVDPSCGLVIDFYSFFVVHTFLIWHVCITT